MKLPLRPHQLVLRIATGASILNSGLNKRGADEDTAMGLHGMAVGTYPFLDKLDPVTFARLLCAGEIALGTALLVPFVPNKLAGAGLSAFAAGLLGMYLRTPGMHKPGSLAPTSDGIPLSKDLWLFGAGLSLILEDCEKD
ncbi:MULTISPECIES: hypothetical protein [unclassified Nocardiopsis]|uniref:hypothetical protein n=1 Tax=unclassified Nocardiopsis TaxID=2649073 RepID=UPI00066B678C|nr:MULTISPECIES: hypothetical protein [unclassified Nocardiopsis]MBQ1083279.1 hypothetical protein [Nocardiopsis sp. B62]